MNQSLLSDIRQVMPLARATGLFVSLCTLQQPDGILIDGGQPSGTFTDVPGLVNIPCMSAPTSDARIQATEMRQLQEIVSEAPRHVLLNDYYPQIEAGVINGWRAIVDGIVYDVLGSESDSQSQMTRLEIRLAGV